MKIMTIHVHTKKLIGILILIFLHASCYNVYSQSNHGGFPIIHNYHPKDYRAESQNWGIASNPDGIMFFANLSGVLEFDGINWKLVPLPQNSFVTSLACDNKGRILAGGAAEFGKLKMQSNGKYVFKSLFNHTEDFEKSSSYIWEITPIDSHGYFKTNETLFFFQDGTAKAIKKSRGNLIFKIRNNACLYDLSPDSGLYRLDKDRIIRCSPLSNLPNKRITGIFPYPDNKLLFYSEDEGFFTGNDLISDTTTLEFDINPLKNQIVARYLDKYVFSNGIQMQNGNYALGTVSGGVVIMDIQGNLLQIIDKSAGLQNETINVLFEDKNQILWLALDNGISSVNLNLPVSFWPQSKGFDGSILAITSFNNQLYIGTWQGIYKLKHFPAQFALSQQKHGSYFEKIHGLNTRVWDLKPFKTKNKTEGKLLAATSYGVFDFTIEPPRQITRGSVLFLHQSKKDKNKIIIGGEHGITVLNYLPESDSFSMAFHIDTIPNKEVIGIEEHPAGTYWITPRSGGIYKLNFINNKPYLEIFNQKNNLPDKYTQYPRVIGDHLMFFSSMGIYALSNNEFKEINQLIGHYIRYNFQIKHVSSTENHLWIQVMNKHNRTKLFFLLEIDKRARLRISFKPVRSMADMGVNVVYADPVDKSVWIGGDDALFLLKHPFNKYKKTKSSTLIRQIFIDHNAIEYSHIQNKSASVNTPIPRFSHDQKSISFEFASTSYLDPKANLYSCFLEGYDEHWSSWSHEPRKEYSNLTPGTYSFHVKSQDFLGFYTEPATFSFTITPPWYFTGWAFLTYLVVITLLITILIKMGNQRLLRTKLLLEETVKERTTEISEQRLLIELEKEKTDKLLRSILPAKIAQELKSKGSVKAQYYDLATIMFMDFKNFSKISQYINPLQLLAELDKSFGHFDEVIERHNLEKIKTIGDAYMCVGGLPVPNLTNPIDAILAAIEVLEFIRLAEKDQWLCDLRIGIHTGELVAGVIGKNRFAYDVWGEAVNTASRMESSGEAGKINISGETYEYVKDFFECEHRGILPAKHRDEFDMYFVKRIRKEFSADSLGKKPNELFFETMKQKFNS